MGAGDALLGMVMEANKRLLDRHMDMRRMEGHESRAGRGDYCLT